MSVTPGYQTFVLDQLRRVVPSVRARRMFGAVGLYGDDLFFAVIDDDILYLKGDDANRGDFEERGMPAFRPSEEMTSMNYYQLPEEVLEDSDALRVWVERSLAAARRKKRQPGSKKVNSKRSSKQSSTASSDLPPGLSQPALRAFTAAGYTRLVDFTRVSEKEVLELHGVGPSAIRILRPALKARGLAFARASSRKNER
jgi:DNA transformation protein